MSNTAEKVPWIQAKENAVEFATLFRGFASEWQICGSVRRGREAVGDIEHVVVHQTVPVEVAGLWGATESTFESRTLARMDALVADGTLEKAVYSNGTHRWGEKYRGVVYKGVRHEVFSADEKNLGAMIAIRTGPAELSKLLVTALLGRGLRQHEGYVRYARGKAEGQIIPCATEHAFFALAGIPYIEPAERDEWIRNRAAGPRFDATSGRPS